MRESKFTKLSHFVRVNFRNNHTVRFNDHEFNIFFVFFSELGEAFKVLGEDPDCRVIVFTGNGKAFCAGIDLNDLMALGNIANDDEKDVARKSFEIFKVIKKFQNSFFEIEKVQSSHESWISFQLFVYNCDTYQ